MATGRLSTLQARLLHLLAGMSPSWTLTGGAALAGFHVTHRETRDLDLFWHRTKALDRLPAGVLQKVEGAGLEASVLQREATFCRLRVTDGTEVVLLDLVADPTPVIEEPVKATVGDAEIAIDTLHEILVNKLCALLGRSELRDLQDVQAILAAGGDLQRGLSDAPRKDGGFSPLTLAWVLRELPVRDLAGSLGLNSDQASALERFREVLVASILQAAKPER